MKYTPIAFLIHDAVVLYGTNKENRTLNSSRKHKPILTIAIKR